MQIGMGMALTLQVLVVVILEEMAEQEMLVQKMVKIIPEVEVEELKCIIGKIQTAVLRFFWVTWLERGHLLQSL